MVASRAADWLMSQGPTRVRLGLALWWAAVIGFMWFPFQFDYQGPSKVTNGVAELDGGGLRFDGPSMLRTQRAPTWVHEATQAAELDVHLEVRSARTNQRGPARILTLSEGRLRRNFMVSQKGADLLVRARRPGADENGAPPLKVDGVFAEPADVTIDVRFRRLMIEVLVNGEPRYREPLESSSLDLWDPTMALAIGNEVTGARRWDGEVRAATASVRSKTFDLLQAPGLLRPTSFWNIPEQTRRLWRFDGSHIIIVETAHLLLFIPFGVLMWLRRRSHQAEAFIRIGLAALFIGLIFQCTKVAFPGRHPSLFHGPFNLAGALIGALWIQRYSRRTTEPSS